MTAAELLQRVREAGGTARLVAGRVRVTAPAGALPDDLLGQLRAHRDALAAYLARDGAAGPSGLEASWQGEETPLAYTQERMWYFSRAGLAPAYNVVAAYRLEGALDRGALRSAIQRLVDRHAVLRSHVVEREGRPYQRYAESLEVVLPVEDVDDVPVEGRVEACLARIRALAHDDFDTTTPPLHAWRLFRLGTEDHVLCCSIHHGLTDARSFDVILDELAVGYEALSRGREPDLPALEVQFPDWIRWQRRALAPDALAEEFEWWERELAPPLPRLELPTDRRRPAVFSLRGADFDFALPKPLVEAFEAAGRRDGATPYMVLMAALKTALRVFTGTDEVIVGTPVAGRTHPEVAGLVGAFLNTLAVRSRVGPRATLSEAVRTERQAVLGALAHPTAPFDMVVRSLGLPRDPSRTPVFQVSLNLWDIRDRPWGWGDLDVTPLRVSTPWTHTEFAMWLKRVEDGSLRGWCTYSTDLYGEGSARRLAQAVRQVLEAYVEASEAPLESLALHGAGDAEDWAALHADPPADPPPAASVHGWVERTAAVRGVAPAVRDAASTLSFEELVRQAHAVAAGLAAAGIGPGDVVGVVGVREARLLPLLLGVLRAGAAYLPLDPEHPEARTAFMLDDAGACAVVGPESQPPDGSSLPYLPVEVLAAGDPAAAPPDRVEESHTAYVIYTSGSTGRPKGTRVTHGNVVSFLAAVGHRIGMTEEDRVVAVTTLSFDISVLELFLPVASGGSVYVSTGVSDPYELAAVLDRERPTVLQAAPSLWRMLLRAGWSGHPGLTALSGGEVLPMDLAAQLLTEAEAVWNLYGPTEATVWATAHRVCEKDLDMPSVPIGRPLAHARAAVVDAAGRPLPTGVVGELVLGGPAVAEGYCGRPELTADRFVEWKGLGRVYRTGDLVRLRHDGALEFFGRMDAQVKIRGHRIEPGEVEAVLREHPRVADAVVDVREVAPGDVRLVAWVVGEGDAQIRAADIRRHGRIRLPDYMIPNFVVPVTSVPRNPSGKVDRSALPHPVPAAATGPTHRPPETRSERLLARVWSEFLGGEEMGRDDNFFERGGHSLLSIRVVARVESETGVRLDPRSLFFMPLEQVAAQLDAERDASAS
ncbi:MAG: amino acid adenylation domain-containing protein [Longimicrobiales bacterium]